MRTKVCLRSDGRKGVTWDRDRGTTLRNVDCDLED